MYLIDSAVKAAVSVRTAGGRAGGRYALDYDIARSNLLNGRLSWYYAAQCCSVGVEYQLVKLAHGGTAATTTDHRVNVSFTLAGLSSFSNFFGALGGSER